MAQYRMADPVGPPSCCLEMLELRLWRRRVEKDSTGIDNEAIHTTCLLKSLNTTNVVGSSDCRHRKVNLLPMGRMHSRERCVTL